MNAADFVELIGARADSAGVKAMLGRLGIEKPPRVKRGDVDALVEAPKHGVALVFEAEKPSDPLVLSDVQFLAGLPSQSCEPFTGALPEGLSFTDDRAAVRAKLGAPSEVIEDTRIDVWGAVEPRAHRRISQGIRGCSARSPQRARRGLNVTSAA